MRLVLLALFAVGAGACGAGLSPAGGTCTSSEECAAGLICDFGKAPHVCAQMGTLATDLSVPVMGEMGPMPDGGPDLASGDLAVPPNADLAQPPPVDMAHPPVDMTKPQDLTPTTD